MIFTLLKVKIEFLNERGYGVGTTEDGKNLFVLNALPGEEVLARPFKRKGDFLYATAEEILVKSSHRIEPLEEHFLACSPWQVMSIDYENEVKKDLVKEFFVQESVVIPDFKIISPEPFVGYRNKVEFSFYSDEEEKISLAYFKREGSKGKYSIDGCQLLHPKMNEVASKIVDFINSKHIKSKQLKGLLLRYSNHTDTVVAALYIKDPELKFDSQEVQKFIQLDFLQGLLFTYSDFRSPAFVQTEELFSFGNLYLTEEINHIKLEYPYWGFFQVNPPVFAKAMDRIRQYIQSLSNHSKLSLVDFYAGVGTIGLITADLVKEVLAVEAFPQSKEFALKNASQNGISNFEFIETNAQDALEYIKSEQILIVDPPRIGLHENVVQKIAATQPKHLIYLSCNPQTQARDLAMLKDFYEIESLSAYNFYPHTPHLESLAILKLHKGL